MKRLIRIIKQVLRRFNNVFYVGSSDILPEPLSKEEEIKYVELFLNGDNNARNKLIEHNLRLVVFLAKKYENTKVDLEDLVSIGTIGLIKGIKTYSMDKNIKLSRKLIIPQSIYFYNWFLKIYFISLIHFPIYPLCFTILYNIIISL